MPELGETLPLLPLTTGVLLPGMVVTMALESDAARGAVETAAATEGKVVVVPHIDGRYAIVGAIAEIIETGELPGGMTGVLLQGTARARLGTAVPGTGQALWVQVEPVDEGEPGPEVDELAKEYRAIVENILVARGARRVAEQLKEVTDPSRVADISGYSPDLSLAQKVQVLETIDVAERLELVLGWAREVLADLTMRDRIKNKVEEGLEKNQRELLLRRQLDAIRK